MKQSHTVRNVVIAIVVLVLALVAAAAAYAYFNQPKEEPVKDTTVVQDGPANVDYKEPEPLLPTIVFTDDGFAQNEYTFPAGMDIRVDNQSSMDLEFSSADHPTHQENPELNMDVLKPGENGTFTPPGKGTYGFHDHINSQFEGTLVIQ